MITQTEPCDNYKGPAGFSGGSPSSVCPDCGWDRSEHSIPHLKEAVAAMAELETPEPVDTDEAHREMALQAMFISMVQQDEDAMEILTPWGGPDEERQELLNDIATMTLHFTIARLHRYNKDVGEPGAFRVRIEVIPEGTPTSPSELLLP